MFKMFYPYEHVSSVFAIDYEALYNIGYRGIIFDIDNTLVHHGDDSTKEIDELFVLIGNVGLKTLLLSNNTEERVKRFLRNIDSPYICDADKPKIDSYLKAVDMLGCKKEEVLFVGDQIFVDIVGANRSGIANILVDFIRQSGETKIGKKRYLEKAILKIYRKSKRFQHRLGDIVKK